jgi:ADP-ribose pyrophosphatase YjhB (NUDIX family)
MIRVITICVFRQDDQILVVEGLDSVKGSHFARPLGGGVEMGENSAQSLKREIREEMAQEITDIKLLGVLESLFTYNGAAGHEIVFVYDARFVDKTVYQCSQISVREPGWASTAVWRHLNSFGAEYRLVPEGLMQLLKT